MKIVIVEDNNDKEAFVRRELSELLPREAIHKIDRAATMSEAARLLAKEKYDLVVLDLMLPFIEGGPAQSDAGIELLRQVRAAGGTNSVTTIVGLSSFADEVKNKRPDFDRLGVLIIEFDVDGRWREGLGRVAKDTLAKLPTVPELDFAIIVALEEEHSGFQHTNLELSNSAVVGGLNVQFVALKSGRRGAIIRLREMGLVAATLDTSSAIKTFKPKAVCMSGICAGMSDHAKPGQLIIASPAWEYQAGKWSATGFEIAPHQVALRPDTRVTLEQTLCDIEIVNSLEAGLAADITRPGRRAQPAIGPAATGSAVVADEKRLEHVQVQHRKLAAIDMETFGVYYAAHESVENPEHFFSIKCVVDMADKGKGDDLHRYGCICSARAVVLGLEALFG